MVLRTLDFERNTRFCLKGGQTSNLKIVEMQPSDKTPNQMKISMKGVPELKVFVIYTESG